MIDQISRILTRTTLVAAMLTATPTFATEVDRVSVRTELQVAMQRHVDRSLVNGILLHVNLDTGALQQYYPTNAHPMIMEGEGYFVVCADLVDGAGTEFDVDFYVVETARGYKVVRTEIDNRSELKTLVADGHVAEY